MTGPLLWDFCWGSPPALPGEDTPCGGATEPLPMLTVASETMAAQSSLETCLEVQSQGAWEGQTTLPRQQDIGSSCPRAARTLKLTFHITLKISYILI